MSVPFFARSNGSWIRATPAYDDGRLYVAGMKDVLVCLDAKTGKQIWKVDFPTEFKDRSSLLRFCLLPLVDGDAVYVQAGGGSVSWKKRRVNSSGKASRTAEA